MAKEVVDKGISVRELERLIKKTGRVPGKKGPAAVSPEEDWVKEIIGKFKTRIKLKRKKRGGLLEIYFHSEEDLIRIVDLLMMK